MCLCCYFIHQSSIGHRVLCHRGQLSEHCTSAFLGLLPWKDLALLSWGAAHLSGTFPSLFVTLAEHTRARLKTPFPNAGTPGAATATAAMQSLAVVGYALARARLEVGLIALLGFLDIIGSRIAGFVFPQITQT